MENDPLEKIVLTREEIEGLRERGMLFVPALRVPKIRARKTEDDLRAMGNLLMLWNRKKISSDDLAHGSMMLFKPEFKKAWQKYLASRISPPRVPLSIERKKERARKNIREWRARNPDWKRFQREGKKLKEQGGYYA